MSRSDAPAIASPLAKRLALLAVFAVSLSIVWRLHDRFWWAPDEGVYAYVAERILLGDVLFRDVQDLHAGYVQFLHVGAMAFFGVDLLSLRYPLALLTVLQAAIIFRLLAHQGVLIAAIAGFVASGLTFVQFLNPSANWYALFLSVILIAVLARHPHRFGDLVLAGFLLGAIFLFRQLTGVLVAIGALSFLLYQLPHRKPGVRSVFGPLLLVIMLAGLIGYLWNKTHGVSFLLFGVWPIAMLVCALVTLRPDDRDVARLLQALAVGAALATAPLAIYFALAGALDDWLHNALFGAIRITQLEFMMSTGYAAMAAMAAGGMMPPTDAVRVLNAFYWLSLLFLPLVVGALCLRAVLISVREKTPLALHPVAYLAPFLALVSVHYQIPIYLMFSTAPLLWALLWIAGTWRRAMPPQFVAWSCTALVGIGLWFHAGQPLSRGLDGIIAGQKRTLEANGIAKASLAMEESDRKMYADLLAMIDRNAAPGETIFAIPVNPELYFLSGRPAAVPFFSTGIGLATNDELERTLQHLREAPPRLIVHRTKDKYNTPLGDRLLAGLLPSYALIGKVEEFDVYARRSER